MYRYIVDRAAHSAPDEPAGSRPLVCISLELFNELPDGTLLYDHSGTPYRKGQGEMGVWQQTRHHPSLNITSAGIANFGFPATADDMLQLMAFTGPYRDS